MPNRYFGRTRRSEQVPLRRSLPPAPPAPVSAKAVPTGGMLATTVEQLEAAAREGADVATALPVGARLVNVLIRMQPQLTSGMPEIGIVLSPHKPQQPKGAPPSPSTNGVCRVKSVIKGSAAATSGNIRAGDVIRRVNMVDVTTLEPEEVVSILRKAVIDCKWTYSPVRLQVARDADTENNQGGIGETDGAEINLMELMSIAIKKNSRMVASKKPNPIRQTLLQRSFCDRLDRALANNGYYDVTYHL